MRSRSVPPTNVRTAIVSYSQSRHSQHTDGRHMHASQTNAGLFLTAHVVPATSAFGVLSVYSNTCAILQRPSGLKHHRLPCRVVEGPTKPLVPTWRTDYEKRMKIWCEDWMELGLPSEFARPNHARHRVPGGGGP